MHESKPHLENRNPKKKMIGRIVWAPQKKYLDRICEVCTFNFVFYPLQAGGNWKQCKSWAMSCPQMKILEGILFYLNCLLKTIQFHQFGPNCECRGRLFKEGHCRRQIFYVCFRAEIKASEWISWKKERNLLKCHLYLICSILPGETKSIQLSIYIYYSIVLWYNSL